MRPLVSLLVAGSVALAGCSDRSGGGDDAGGRLRVVTTLAPITELARTIGGDRVDVRSVAPAGGDAHDLELSTDDVDAIEDADVVLYIGGDFQPAVERVARRAKRAVDVAGSHSDQDVHFWLDPLRLKDAAALIADAVGGGDAELRLRQVAEQLDALDAELDEGLEQCERRLLVTSHEAFGMFAERYDLEQEAIADHSAEEEPDAARIAEVADLVRREGVTTVFGEPGVENDVAAAVAREAGVAVATLDPAERSGASYVSVMRSNLQAIRTALGCR